MHPFKQKKIMVPDALQFLDRDVQQNVYDIDIVRRAYGQRLSFHQTKLARHDGFSEDAVSLARLQSEIFAGKIKRMDAATAVSYTHLTLPTKRIVYISVVGLSIKKT